MGDIPRNVVSTSGVESKQLVRMVMERVDASSAEAFAERMGWGFGRVRLIRLWLAGTSQPSYPYLMEMLEAAGMLCLEPAEATPPVAAAAPVRTADPVEDARQALGAAADALERVAVALRSRAGSQASAN